ncbi:MAG: anaerobic ribonucleoside-triphosphate reductase activating protein [Firmicutes bacterium]|nr:anaerobic ribonucleoside-triphosphate reductase activating protein [Bacillota bacterium]
MNLNLGGLIEESLVDGPGIRLVIFAQGCKHQCPGCFNEELQAFETNTLMTVEELLTKIDQLPHLSGVTLSGGDPFEQAREFASLAKEIKKRNLSVWAYTGYYYEELEQEPEKRQLLTQIDVLVDGPFEMDKKDITLPYRGSSNQRIIDVQQSLHKGKVILYEL